MMLSRSQTPGPRPRPPAKMRRQTSLSGLRVSTTGGRQVSLTSAGSVSPSTSTPPPAYGSAYELRLPEDDSTDQHISDTLLGSPIPTTFKLMGYRHRGMKEQFFGEPAESDEWMNQSKEELAELLVKAEDIIKERENELDVTSSAVKNLFRENITLKTKHEALLARMPSSGPNSNTSSPDRVISRSNSFGYNPESPLGARSGSSPSLIAPPPHYRGHVRNKVSMSTADISLLADQNAELMNKLEQLESESTSADHAGRRELKRLEKEITMLREALEKTQAKSQELEEKTKGLDKGIDKAVEEAWKRKKEREQRIKAMRGSRMQEEETTQIRDFAPKGSKFGGPSKHFPLSKSLAGKPSPQFELEDEGDSLSSIEAEVPAPPQPKPEIEIISQLLQKVKELEETNSRILQQQAETANQLQAVQRDTEHINKVYECLADPQTVEVELAEDSPSEKLPSHVLASSASSTTKFGSFRRRIEAQMVDRDSIRLKAPVAKSRKSLAGLFGERHESSSSSQTLDLPEVPFNSWWSESRHRSSLSMSNASIASPALSSLDFTSPHNDVLAELSPIGTRLSLESELQHFQGEMHNWEFEQQKSNWHLRSQSLSNISQLSLPSSPTPLASSFSTSTDRNKTPLASEFPPQVNVLPPPPPPPRTPPQSMPGTFGPQAGTQAQPGLNIEPPTPSKHEMDQQQQPIFQREESPADSLNMLQATRSPRHEFISQRIKARKARWEDGRFGSVSSTASVWGSPTPERRVFDPVFVPPQFANVSTTSINSFVSATSSSVNASPMRISTIVDTLVDQFEGVGDGIEEDGPDSEYEDAADYANESSFGETEDEYGEEEEEGDGLEYDDEDTMVNKTPQLTQDNALQLHQTHEKTPKHRPSPKIIVVNGDDLSTQQNTTKNAAASTSKAGRWGSVLLELWLWLQFAVIIFVFLYAMAKRGPKAVLADAEQRTRTRKQSLRMGR